MHFNNYCARNFDPKLMHCITAIDGWCSRNHATFGVAGSFANGGFKDGSDLDIVLILKIPDDSPQKIDSALPDEFYDESWQDFLLLVKTESAYVFGGWSNLSDLIRLEVYPISVVKRILNLEEFVIKRLRKGPVADKKIVLFGTNGSKRERVIRPKHIPAICKFYSEVDSVIWEGDSLFVGMHLERLLLTTLIKDELAVDNIRANTWNALAGLLGKQPVLPFGGRFERIFFASRKMSEMKRKEIRQMLA